MYKQNTDLVCYLLGMHDTIHFRPSRKVSLVVAKKPYRLAKQFLQYSTLTQAIFQKSPRSHVCKGVA